MKQVTVDWIIKEYRKGRRDFRNIVCKGANLVGLTFKNVDFSNSDLSYASFEASTLINVKFTNCKLEWSDFSKAKLKNVSFEKAKLSWSKFSDAHFENVNMKRSDLSYTLMFNVDLKQADLTDAITFKLTRSEGQLEKEGVEKSKAELARLRSSAPFETWLKIKFSVGQVEERFRIMNKVGNFFRKYTPSLYEKISHYFGGGVKEKSLC